MNLHNISFDSDIAGVKLRGQDSLQKAVDSVRRNKIGLQGTQLLFSTQDNIYWPNKSLLR